MADIQIQQQQGSNSEIKRVKKGKLQSGTAYEFPEHEKDLVHVELELPEYNRMTGEKTSRPFKQTFYPQEFKQMFDAGAFAFMTINVLHAPSGFTMPEKKEIKANETKELIPQIKSDPGAGTPLIELLDKKDLTGLRAIHKDLYPEIEDNASLTKEEIVQDITERVGVWKEETKEDLRAQYENRLRGLGLV